MSTRPEPTVSVIIRTLAEATRRTALHRAIESVLDQQGIGAVPIVVANGDRFDHDLVRDLAKRSDLRYHYLPEASLPLAMQRGRAMVETPFFCFLDDDDEYLPHGLESRVAALSECDHADALVGAGYRLVGGRQYASGWKRGTGSACDPLRELLSDNWLPSCGGLFRSSSIGVEFFSDAPAYFEWTYLAFKLCIEKKLAFSDVPAHVTHDTEASSSKSEKYRLAEASVIAQILDLPLRRGTRRALRERERTVMHDIAEYYRVRRRHGLAWRFHAMSLVRPNGIKYLPYTRKLLFP